MTSRRKTPADMAAIKKSRSSFTGACTRAIDKLKAYKSDDPAAISTLNTCEIEKIITSIKKTEAGISNSLEDAQEFAPDGEAEDFFQQEEEAVRDAFESSIFTIIFQAEQLLTLKGVLNGLRNLTHDLSNLSTTLAARPDNDHSTALQPLQLAGSKMRDDWDKANLPADHLLKGELDACIDKIQFLAADVAAAKDKATHPPLLTSTSERPHYSSGRSDLPTIDVPTFNGDIMEWATFWAAFKSTVDCRKDLSNTKKLIYLRKAVKDSNTQLLLHSPSETEDMYLDVVKLLQSRFNRTREVHRQLTKSLMHLQPPKHTREDLRFLGDTVQRKMDGLKTNGHYNADALLTFMVYLVLPSRLQTLWDQYTKKEKGVPPIPDLLAFISEHAETLLAGQPTAERSAEAPERKTPRRQDKKPEQHKQRSHVHVVSSPSTPSYTYKWECVLCKPDKHPLHVCPQWLGYSVAQRLSHVKAKNLCSNCLAVGHLTTACKSTYRCRDCGQAHHTTIHQESSPPSGVHSTMVQSQQVPDALLMTAEVLLKGPGGQELKARAFLDPGAAISLISSRVTQILDLPLEASRVRFSAVQGTPCKGAKYLTSVTISPLHYKKEIQCRPAVVQTVTDDIPNRPLAPVHEFPHLLGLRLADPQFNIPGKVDILLGADLWLQLQEPTPPITALPTEPGAQATIFGWVISGPAKYNGEATQISSAYHLQPTVTNEDLSQLVQRFWLSENTEEPELPVSLIEAEVQLHYSNHVSYSPSACRYQVALPKKPDCQPLGESRSQAVQRYFSNEKSIIRRKVWKDFQQVIQGYLDLEHAEKVPPAELHLPHYYLPMHSVVKHSSTSTKLRVVFDGSATTSTGVSLNQSLQVGPTLHPTLGSILIRFRAYPVALTADVTKMYREVELVPEDRDLHRFIWRPTPEQPIQDYRMRRVTFGVSASPYLAVRTLQQTASDHEEDHPIATNHILTSFYVDDLLAGADTEEEAVELFSSLRSVLQKGGFNLCKFRSSSTTVLQSIPQDLQEKLPVKDVTTLHSSSHPKALGLEWDSRQDFMSPSINMSTSYSSTKRGIISDVSKTFDILGWISPAVLSMKLLYQQLWEKGQEWDDTVSPDLAEQHAKWREELPCLSQQQLPRCYSLPNCSPITQELHGFSDASLKAYGAVVYLRTTYHQHSPTISLVTAKTKVAKKNPPTVPKLELCGAVLLTKLLTHVSTVLNIPIERINAWTDSSIVLAWLDGQPREFKQFVANRVSFILQATTPHTWKHVPTRDNPADCSSRGMMPAELLNHSLWWNGPSWLYQDHVQVPYQPPRRALPPPEIRTVHAIMIQSDLALRLGSVSNNYHFILSVTAWCLRFFHQLKEGRPDPDTRWKHLTYQELQTAEHWLWRHSQDRSFPKERRALLKHHCIAPSSRLRALAPLLDEEELLRVGGRLSNSNLTKSQQHPVIVDSKDSKLFNHMHVCLGHCGPSLLLCHTGNKLHVVGARQLSRDVCSQCVTCKRAAPRPVPQLLGDLPSSRIESNNPTFSSTGMDFAGPFMLKKGHTRRPVKVKAYVCVFICLATKAVHLEVTTDLTTAAFIASLKRFIARRGCPETLHCDNGSNFVGARNELRDLYHFLADDNHNNLIHQHLLKNRVNWTHIPERAPHFGGLWESAVRSMKKHLRRLMGSLLLTYEEMTTITCQVEACLNSRPLIPMTSHSQDGLSTLTASHFLLFNAPKAYPEDPRLPEEPRLLKRWNQCQAVVQHFWSRWSREYLNTLQSRTKWQSSKPNLREGDIVILKEDRTFACHWPLARITQTYPGPDGLVRVAKIKTATGVYKRPVTKLALLHRPDSSQEPSSHGSSPGSMSRQEPSSPEHLQIQG